MQQNGHTLLSGKIESLVTCKIAQGTALQAPILRLSQHSVVFEVNDLNCVLRSSEVLTDFQIKLNNRVAYAGRAVIANLINTGAGIICEATLDGIGLDAGLPDLGNGPLLKKSFSEFLTNWGKSYRIQPDFKVLIADMNSYLSDLRLWLEHVELSIRSAPAESRAALERQVLTELHQPLVVSLNALFEKFELVAEHVAPDDKPAHRNWVRRQIHPLILCSPFADRTYHKPLGYAGDYEMVNMILRDPYEGGSLFAKALNGWFLSQPPAEAHRNRITFLTQQLIQETARVSATGRKARIFNLGCGPAGEVQRFLTEMELSNQAEFTLLDFNDETLAYTTNLLNQLKTRHQRSTQIKMLKKSVAQILMGRGKSSIVSADIKYDFVYCAGLFDYLPDNYCRQLMDIFYEMLAPGGLLVATNVDAVNPIQQMLDYVLDWVLIYRGGSQLAEVAPQKADPDRVSVAADVTSVNIYLTVRKPAL
jgi:extracellular factor (EF) 3-hydroxypalmitic acid methyl ester biosynthesis protein